MLLDGWVLQLTGKRSPCGGRVRELDCRSLLGWAKQRGNENQKWMEIAAAAKVGNSETERREWPKGRRNPDK